MYFEKKLTLMLNNPFRRLKLSGDSVVEINDMLGFKIITEQIHPMTSSHRMNLEKLLTGVYFIKFGDRVEKFVKLLEYLIDCYRMFGD